ncbi:hypothetical protein ACET3Z_009973 [Daucus carota]
MYFFLVSIAFSLLISNLSIPCLVFPPLQTKLSFLFSFKALPLSLVYIYTYPPPNFSPPITVISRIKRNKAHFSTYICPSKIGFLAAFLINYLCPTSGFFLYCFFGFQVKSRELQV